MLIFGRIINTLLAVSLCLIRDSGASSGYYYEEATQMTPLRRDITNLDQQVLTESLSPEESRYFEAITSSTREHWMRRAKQALSDLASPCPYAAFGAVIVNHTDTSSSPDGRLICVGINAVSRGNPILHGEIQAINNCSEVLQSPAFGLTPEAAMLAFHDLTLYTTAEPCPMCASAIRWAGFRECVYGTSLDSLIRFGWAQLEVSSREVFDRSTLLSPTTALIPDVLPAEMDPLFAWQFDVDAPCPDSCNRDDTGMCVPT
ncbi:cytidine deaminase-like protein [Xylariaceae sp. FL1019]|nr:cytidine deaminase-like protein [Xylariaceae sp. FL1019]